MNSAFVEGVRSAFPITLGYLPLGFAYGVLAREAGLTLLETVLMSVLVYAGSGQYIAVSLIGAQAHTATIISTVFFVNLRHLLFSASFVPHLKGRHPLVLAAIASEITDETFAVAISHYARYPARTGYHLGLHLTAHSSWIIASFLGGFTGNWIGDPTRFGLNFALPAMFIALLSMQLHEAQVEKRLGFPVAFIAAGLSVFMALKLPGNWNVIIAALLAATLGVIMEGWLKK